MEIWTSPGPTMSDKYADIIFEELAELEWRERTDYTDGYADKEARFWVLVNTIAPAILLELGFYSNPEEAKKMKSVKFQRQMAEKIFNGIQKIVNA